MKKMIIVLLSMLLFTACLKDKIPFHYTICVNILQARTNNAVKGADVYLYSRNGSTLNLIGEQQDVNGYCEFEGLERAGSYLVRVKSEPEYHDGEMNIGLDNEKKNLVNVSLEPF